jgi:hypothetical protein
MAELSNDFLPIHLSIGKKDCQLFYWIKLAARVGIFQPFPAECRICVSCWRRAQKMPSIGPRSHIKGLFIGLSLRFELD